MKAIVDQDTGSGCTLCAQPCPDISEMDGDTAKVFVDIVPDESLACARKAADECPVAAISIPEQKKREGGADGKIQMQSL